MFVNLVYSLTIKTAFAMSTTASAPAPVSNLAARPSFKEKYDHFIGGQWVAPASGEYFDNISPIDGKVFTRVARGNAKDIDRAIEAAHTAFPLWSKTSAAYRSNILLKIAQIVEDNLEKLAVIETIDNGKAIRESRAADLPLVVDHFRYYAGVIRSEEGTVSCVTTFGSTEEAIEIANDTLYGLGAGVWTRDAHELYQVPRAIQAGRVWVNCYHAYPAHTPFGGYKKSGFGRETHKMMLNHYRQTKNMLISYSKTKLGFF
jgi:acyl-CoA reductase-like NAD-dependent aldehyde dehydrogenase